METSKSNIPKERISEMLRRKLSIDGKNRGEVYSDELNSKVKDNSF